MSHFAAASLLSNLIESLCRLLPPDTRVSSLCGWWGCQRHSVWPSDEIWQEWRLASLGLTCSCWQSQDVCVCVGLTCVFVCIINPPGAHFQLYPQNGCGKPSLGFSHSQIICTQLVVKMQSVSIWAYTLFAVVLSPGSITFNCSWSNGTNAKMLILKVYTLLW